ncbi:4Fe-4S binding protein [uncultured Duncaniella sp.]|uniref:4Fe-4S binding protein n=1 Tax=uncultured Duncaniella sp. TaxID=2768039 RepID=UPI00263887CC|nr:4Fe-4S binding protein [uncultured Duncaniella sp.]
MGSVKEYFSNLGSGIASLIKGMQVTGKEFVTPKITEEYPDNRDNLPVADRFRAVLTLKYDDQGDHKCIACGTCERVCPNNTISLGINTVETWDGKKKKKLDKYMYDLGSCTFCQLCVTNCPTDALEFSNDFEQAVFTRGKLLRKLNYLPEKEEPQPTPEEIARMKAEKEAKIAAAKAAAEAKKAAAAASAGAAPKAADAAAPAPKAAPAPEANDAAAKALAAAAGDPVKEAKIRAALEKAAALKAQREAGKAPEAK